MKKSTAVWLIVAASLILIGSLIFVGAMLMLKWNFKEISTVKYQTNTYEITENFKNISVDTNTADLTILPSDDEKIKVVCHEESKLTHSVRVEDGTLKINVIDSRKWYDYITIFDFDTPQITLYLPAADYSALLISLSTGNIEISDKFSFDSINIGTSTGDVNCLASSAGEMKIKTSTGKINIENITASNIELEVSTGKITAKAVKCDGIIKLTTSTGETSLADVTCRALVSVGNTGDLDMINTVASESFDIKRTTGDIHLDACDAAEISIETDTGNVKGSLLTEKVFLANTSTGNITLPKTTAGGKCSITTSTGDIYIEIK